MTDIVERLRSGDVCDQSDSTRCKVMNAKSGCDCAEAADTITALRDELNRWLTGEEIRAMQAEVAKERDCGQHYREEIGKLRAENERLKKEALFTAISVLPEKDAENERLRAALCDAAEQMEWLAENDPHCMGWVGPPWPSTTPAIKVAAEKARAALEPTACSAGQSQSDG